MQRALQLARFGELHASPNPMVGAVIVAPDGRIIGEGWHRRCGEAHAEVNAVASIAEADKPLLRESTMYVTLEPCCHYGKTPPCADLIIATGIPRVVVATADPFSKVGGRGLQKLRDNGIDVEVGDMEEEAQALNRRFFTAHTQGRPYVTLKWAQSADGYIDGRDASEAPAAQISGPVSRAAVHRLRALHDAILVGSGTFLADRPSLTLRHYAGRSPRPFVLDRRGLTAGLLPEGFTRLEDATPADALRTLHDVYSMTSVLVEGGRRLLQSFIDAGLYDDIIIESNHDLFLHDKALKTEAPNV